MRGQHGLSTEDAFDDEGFDTRYVTSSGSTDLDALMRDARARPSLLRNMERLLVVTRDRLARDWQARRAEADALLGELSSSSGLDVDKLQERRGALLELRGEMKRIRRRLASIQRRLVVSGSAAGQGQDAQALPRLAGQLGALEKLPPGVDRSLSALAGVARSQIGTTGAWRLDVPEGIDRAAFGSALARQTPGATTTAVAHELAGGFPADASEDPLLTRVRLQGPGTSAVATLTTLTELCGPR